MRIMGFKLALAVSVVLGLGTSLGRADSVTDFYKGKMVSVYVGFDPGGGYDLYARLLAQFLSAHIPGKPSVIVQNMSGAGSVRAANFVYRNAPKDGTAIAAVAQNVGFYQYLGGQSAEFDVGRFYWLGSMAASNSVIYTWHTSPVKTITDAEAKVAVMGSTGLNSDSHVHPSLTNNLLGTKFKIIDGYTGGSAGLNLALERGEIDGRGSDVWAGVLSGHRDWLQANSINVLLQIGLKSEPEIPQVPLLLDLVTDTEARQIATVVTLPTAIGYGEWVAPEVPSDRQTALRAAYAATMTDPALLAAAKQENIVIRPIGGADIEALTKQVAAVPKSTLAKAAQMFDWR